MENILNHILYPLAIVAGICGIILYIYLRMYKYQVKMYNIACNASFDLYDYSFKNATVEIYPRNISITSLRNDIETVLREKIATEVSFNVNLETHLNLPQALKNFHGAESKYADNKFQHQEAITRAIVTRTSTTVWKHCVDYINDTDDYELLYDLYQFLNRDRYSYVWKSDRKWPLELTILAQYISNEKEPFSRLNYLLQEKMVEISKKESLILCNINRYDHYVDIYEREWVKTDVRNEVAEWLEKIGKEAAKNIAKDEDIANSKHFLDELERIGLLLHKGGEVVASHV